MNSAQQKTFSMAQPKDEPQQKKARQNKYLSGLFQRKK
jgi:hypothetical protein